jgi:hypothetical protein
MSGPGGESPFNMQVELEEKYPAMEIPPGWHHDLPVRFERHLLSWTCWKNDRHSRRLEQYLSCGHDNITTDADAQRVL